MPTVSKRSNPKGKVVYRINYVTPWDNVRHQPVVGTRKDEAVRKANLVYEDMMSRYFGESERKLKPVTFKLVLDEFYQSKINRVRDSTIKRYKIYTDNYQNFMSENFSSIVNISQVTKAQIEEFLNYLKERGQAPGTINAELRVLRSFFKFSVEYNYLFVNPADKIDRFLDPKKSEEVKFWSIKQVNTILTEVKVHWRDKYDFLFHTGIREGELINLKWEAVVLDENDPKIKIQASEDWLPKTNQRREIPLNNKAFEIIKRQLRFEKHDYVFTTFEGHKIKEKIIYDNLKSALKRLNYYGSVHTFRHTFASQLVMAGANIFTVSKLLGHSSIEMTEKYAHLAPDHLRKSVDLLIKD